MCSQQRHRKAGSVLLNWGLSDGKCTRLVHSNCICNINSCRGNFPEGVIFISMTSFSLSWLGGMGVAQTNGPEGGLVQTSAVSRTFWSRRWAFAFPPWLVSGLLLQSSGSCAFAQMIPLTEGLGGWWWAGGSTLHICQRYEAEWQLRYGGNLTTLAGRYEERLLTHTLML